MSSNGSNGSQGLLCTLIGPMIWMALLLSVLSSKADGAIDVAATGTAASPGLATASAQMSPESQMWPSFEPLTFHASAGCLASPGDGT
jgi:hypothetical protein